MKIFIVGINGFIGSALTKAILSRTDWSVLGIDLEQDRLDKSDLECSQLEFCHGDLSINQEWVESAVLRSDVVIPLAAVAVPRIYIKDPLQVFKLDFLENLRIIEHVVKYKKRLIFPSTSEVYGMCEDEAFHEETSNFVLGPISKHRWIYSCSKQLLDRVIHAYGIQEGLDYCCFRPFNWIGPGLDRMEEKKIGNSRVVTQFIADIRYNRPIQLVDGGLQRRCLLFLQDGIDALLHMIKNDGGKASGQIFNIGNPENEISMQTLAEKLVKLYQQHPRSRHSPYTAKIEYVSNEAYYGEGYQDVTSRKPSIEKARTILGWTPQFSLETALRETLHSFLDDENSWGRFSNGT